MHIFAASSKSNLDNKNKNKHKKKCFRILTAQLFYGFAFEIYYNLAQNCCKAAVDVTVKTL